jgi:bacillolysin
VVVPGDVPGLAWQVTVIPPATIRRNPGGATVLIDADGVGAGTLLLTTAASQPASVTTTAKDYRGVTRTITVDKSGSWFFSKQTLVDAGRDLTTYTTSYSFFGLGGPVLPGTVVKRTGKGWNTDAVSAHANAAAVLDFYRDVLGRDSFDGAGIPVKLSINYNPKTTSGGYDNAFWDPDAGQFAFGDSGHLDAALDVVGHEFTHAVISYVVGDGGSVLDNGESGSLNEAFADIMGLLIENKSGTDRWLMGEDSGDGAIRDLADPESIVTGVGAYEEDYADRYLGTADDGGEHLNSTIFSHAAYLMMTDPATAGITDDEWAQVFYRALYRLTPTSVFTDGRAAVLSSARALDLDEAEIGAIAQAFDEVGILDPSATVSV